MHLTSMHRSLRPDLHYRTTKKLKKTSYACPVCTDVKGTSMLAGGVIGREGEGRIVAREMFTNISDEQFLV